MNVCQLIRELNIVSALRFLQQWRSLQETVGVRTTSLGVLAYAASAVVVYTADNALRMTQVVVSPLGYYYLCQYSVCHPCFVRLTFYIIFETVFLHCIGRIKEVQGDLYPVALGALILKEVCHIKSPKLLKNQKCRNAMLYNAQSVKYLTIK